MWSKKELRENFYIKDGDLYWKKSPARRIKSDTRAGGYDGYGYRKVRFKGKLHLVHRVIWAIHHDEWPNGEIDHINGIKDDNRIENLRLVTSQQNKANTGIRSHNTSGFRGVSYYKRIDKYRATIGVDGNHIHLGYYPTPEEASRVYKETTKEWFGEFRRRLLCGIG